MQAYRWIEDSRDEYTKERLEALDDSFKVCMCMFVTPPSLMMMMMYDSSFLILHSSALSLSYHYELLQGLP